MSEYSESQKSHYEKQYCDSDMELSYQRDGDLWTWAKWYPLLELEDFLMTIAGKKIVVTCCGAGRELGFFHKYGIKTTATDLTTKHLASLVEEKFIESAEIQNAEKLTYDDDSFDYGFVNAGLHHLAHPHAGLNELMRVGRDAAIFIESQDAFCMRLENYSVGMQILSQRVITCIVGVGVRLKKLRCHRMHMATP